MNLVLWRAGLGFALIVLTSLAILAQSLSISIDQPYAGDRNVTGQGIPGSAPLTAYDVTNGARNYLGKSSSVDQQGFYAIAVSPQLTNGQKIVVVDSQNRASAVVPVVVKSGPAGPGN
jgi:hypothetical protein